MWNVYVVDRAVSIVVIVFDSESFGFHRKWKILQWIFSIDIEDFVVCPFVHSTDRMHVYSTITVTVYNTQYFNPFPILLSLLYKMNKCLILFFLLILPVFLLEFLVFFRNVRSVIVVDKDMKWIWIGVECVCDIWKILYLNISARYW